MLSPDGHCHTFDHRANGYVRAEGGGCVILQRVGGGFALLRQPLAMVAGTAVNQDGRSVTITAPNGPAQQEVIRGALRNAGLEPDDVDYLETHGTGTCRSYDLTPPALVSSDIRHLTTFTTLSKQMFTCTHKTLVHVQKRAHTHK